MLRSLTILLTMAILSSCTLAAELSCEITEFGILAPLTQKGVRDAQTTATGKVREYGEIKIQQRTDIVTARLGTRFGVRHIFRDVPANGELQVLVIHPAIVRASVQTSAFSSAAKHPGDSGTSYGFDNPSELLPETWSFEFKYRGKLLCRKAFTVIS